MSVEKVHSSKRKLDVDDSFALAMTSEDVEKKLRENALYLQEWQSLIIEAEKMKAQDKSYVVNNSLHMKYRKRLTENLAVMAKLIKYHLLNPANKKSKGDDSHEERQQSNINSNEVLVLPPKK